MDRVDNHMAAKREDANMSDRTSTVFDDDSVVADRDEANNQRVSTPHRRNLSLIDEDPAIIEIISGSQSIPIHKTILCDYSLFFADHFDFNRNPLNRIEMPGEAWMYRTMFHWMYYQQLFPFSGHVISELDLVRLWGLADHLGVSKLCNTLVDILCPRLNNMTTNLGLIKGIWEYTERDSKLRCLAVAVCARNGNLRRFNGNEFPIGFCTLLIRELYDFKDRSFDWDREGDFYVCDFHDHPDDFDCNNERM